MEANETRIRELIRKGEGLELEFKTCRNQLSRDVYETVCAFLNRHGGTLLFGHDNQILQVCPAALSSVKSAVLTSWAPGCAR